MPCETPNIWFGIEGRAIDFSTASAVETSRATGGCLGSEINRTRDLQCCERVLPLCVYLLAPARNSFRLMGERNFLLPPRAIEADMWSANVQPFATRTHVPAFSSTFPPSELLAPRDSRPWFFPIAPSVHER